MLILRRFAGATSHVTAGEFSDRPFVAEEVNRILGRSSAGERCERPGFPTLAETAG